MEQVKAEEFRAKYAALAREYGLQVKSCGCCGLWVDRIPTYDVSEDLEDLHLHERLFRNTGGTPPPEDQ